jgi:hypothetical protein
MHATYCRATACLKLDNLAFTKLLVRNVCVQLMQVRLDFRQEGWDWSLVQENEISAEYAPSSARLTIDSAK